MANITKQNRSEVLNARLFVVLDNGSPSWTPKSFEGPSGNVLMTASSCGKRMYPVSGDPERDRLHQDPECGFFS